MYVALYRQWRPQSFADMVGQEHVCQTLIAALEQNKVAHAYLFSGPRGTGKTTVARLLAKALNCADRQGIEPCRECHSCREVDQGVAIDVAEIDAASNRGIDEIRDLREKVRLTSAGGKYKVYIIDEVHMLTAEAFNALLKTLEDPPQRVVFILATTEAHRVPATILSRVQHFEFRRIGVGDVERRLGEVCREMGREVDAAALRVIALKCEGGLRDALSMLDQCLHQEGRLGAEDILRQLGMMGESGSADLVEGLLQGGYADILRLMEENMELGRDPRQILRELLDYLREMMIHLAGGSLSPRAAEALERLGRQAKEATLDRVLGWIHLLLKGEADLKYAPNARLAVEMLLVQAIYTERGSKPDQGAHGVSAAGKAGSPRQEGKLPAFSVKETSKLPGKYDTPGKTDTPGKVDAEAESVHHGNEGQVGNTGQKDRKTDRQTPSTPAEVSDAGQAGKQTDKQADEQAGKQTAEQIGGQGDRRARGPEAGQEDNQTERQEFTTETWQEIMSLVRKRSKPVHAFLLAGEPYYSDGKIQVVFPRSYAFHCEMLNQEVNKKTLKTAIFDVMGRDVPAEGVVGSPPQHDRSNSAEGERGATAQLQEQTAQLQEQKAQEKNQSPIREEASQTGAVPLNAVEKALEIFGSSVVVVREEE
jgi:DNA polymerase-3 subunit gamma/tau